jgi:hypothetical protein
VGRSGSTTVHNESFPAPNQQTQRRRDLAVASGSDQAAQQPADKPPVHAHTGFKALVFETASDFKAFPLRRSTWVILAIGGAAAAVAHPADVEVTEHLSTSDAARKFFVAGKWIGSSYVQAGTAIGLYVVGRYMLPHEYGESKTNKVSPRLRSASSVVVSRRSRRASRSP